MNFPDNCQDCPVWKHSLFKDFGSELIYWLAGKKISNTFKKKEILFTQGQPVKGVYCHMSGLAKVVQKNATARVRFSRLVLPGDTSGHRSLFIETNYKGTADVISNTLRACFIPKDDILHLLSSNSSFAKNLVVKISTELKRAEEDKISSKEKSARGRLAQLLCELSRNYSEKINDSIIPKTQYLIKSEITKKDIASLLSVANETVIRLMSDMKSEELIRYQDKKLLILDYENLLNTR